MPSCATAAAAGQLHRGDVLLAQARRMCKDMRIRRMATEFACQWLHIYDFASLDEKSERHFPTFAGLRGSMEEEAILFFTDLFQNDGSVLSVFDGDHTFLNEDLAKHYGIPGVTGADWRRVDGVRKFGRGGILALAATLAKQSGASRTSPILRGNWVSEVLLGERLPRPPKNVPRAAGRRNRDQGPHGASARREAHQRPALRELPRRGSIRWALRSRPTTRSAAAARQDLGNRPIETSRGCVTGRTFEGLEGLRHYLVTQRRDAVIRQFCRKLLGYALGRGIQLSDEPLLEEMERALKKNDYRFSAALEAIVASRQFREIRGRDSLRLTNPIQ